MIRIAILSIAAALILTGGTMAVDYHGIIQKIDADKGLVSLRNPTGQEFLLRVARDLKVFDEAGRALPAGIRAKELHEGVQITFKRVRERSEEKEQVGAIFLGIRKRRFMGDGSALASVGLKPLSEMAAQNLYLGEDGGLYGGGRNEPPPAHHASARLETARIEPLDADGRPAKEGRVVLISISMSNGTQEFSLFKALADADPQKSPAVTIVDCAQGSMTMAAWARLRAKPDPWPVALERLEKAGLTPRQVQVAWIKPANAFPKGDLWEHGTELLEDTRETLQRAKVLFPNLRVAYLSSRIYAGYGTMGPAGDLNPEPYAYETAFAVRRLIQEQFRGNAEFNFDPARGAVKMPLLLWGAYLWADGTNPRRSDGLTWGRQDISSDGIHPSEKGKQKVADLLLEFFKNDALAKTCFVKK